MSPANIPMKNRKISKEEQKKSIVKLLHYVFKYYTFPFIGVVFCIIFATLANVAGSYFIGTILINGFLSPAIVKAKELHLDSALSLVMDGQIKWNNISFSTAYIIVILIYVLGIISNYLYSFIMSAIGQGTQKRLRDSLYSHMQDLPIKYFDSRTHGDIMSIYTNDIDALREMLSRALPIVVTSLMTMVACSIMMLVIDLFFSIIVFLFAVIIILLTKTLTKKAGKNFIQQQITLGKTNGYVEEMISGQKVVKVFNYEKRNIEQFDKLNETLFEKAVKANRFSSILMPSVNQLGNLQYVLIALLGAIFISNNFVGVRLSSPMIFNYSVSSIGTIISFLLLSKNFTQPIGQISTNFNVIILALAGASRIFNLMDVKEEEDKGYVELVHAKIKEDGSIEETSEKTKIWAWKHPHSDGSTTYTLLKGKINFYDVDFGYSEDKIVLHNISLYAEPGQKVAFVGPTGAGKTTITNLLNRFYEIADGKVRYDDININKIKKSDLRKSLGMVLQDTKLFTGTVKDNIRFGNLDATDEEIINASKLAFAHDFIMHLPNGYDTVLKNGGASLSQGQRQLIAIARAAVSDPPVMILDEATSSIDSRTEEIVQKGMDSIMKGRTVFVIAHRLSTIKNANVIMVLENGSIIERGTHDDLIKQKGKYYQLYTGNKASK